MKEATVTILAARDIVRFASTYGVEAHALCTAAGIDPTLLEDPNQRLPGPPLEALWREAVRMSGDDHFGLHLATQFSMTDLTILGYVMLNCATLGQAIANYREVQALLARWRAESADELLQAHDDQDG